MNLKKGFENLNFNTHKFFNVQVLMNLTRVPKHFIREIYDNEL